MRQYWQCRAKGQARWPKNMPNGREWLRTSKVARHLRLVPGNGIKVLMNKCHRAALAQIFAKPVSGSIKWADIEALLAALGGEISERQGSRIGVYLFGEVRVFHRPHPSPDTDKGAIASIKKWLESHGVKP